MKKFLMPPVEDTGAANRVSEIPERRITGDVAQKIPIG